MHERKPLIIASLFLIYAVFAILLNSVGSVILQVQNSFSVTASEASVLEAYKDLSIAIASFLVASFVAQVGYKRSMLAALALVLAVLVAMPQLPSFWMNKLLFMATGISFAVVKVSIFATLGLLTNNTRQHASLMSFLEAFFMVGVLSGYFLFGAYVDDNASGSLQWYNVYYPLAGMTLLAMLALMGTALNQGDSSVDVSESSVKNFTDMLALSIKPLVMVFVVSVFLYVLIEQGIMSWLPTFNNVMLNLPASLSIQMASIMAASIAFGRFLAGYLTQRINWYPLLCLCLLLAGALVLAAMPMARAVDPNLQVTSWLQAPLAAFVFPLIGLCLAPVYPIINSVVLSSLPKHQHAPMTGLIVVFSALGGTLGSIITGSLFQAFDGATAFYFSLVPLTGILIALFFLKRHTDNDEPNYSKQAVAEVVSETSSSDSDQSPLANEQAYPEVFHAVQTSGLLPDSKTFADARPKIDPQQIKQAFSRLSKSSDFNLEDFLNQHFVLPKHQASLPNTSSTLPIREHLSEMWTRLERAPDSEQEMSSLIPLPHPYLVPGGRFREIYYWDSYFTMLGYTLDRGPAMLEHMVENFAYLTRTLGHIPNGNRSYFSSRSQPPVLALMLELLAEYQNPKKVYSKYLDSLVSEYQFWMRGADELVADGQANQRVIKVGAGYLNRYWDSQTSPRPESYAEDVAILEQSSRPENDLYRNIRAACESGWDFSARWLDEKMELDSIKTTSIIPVDLNVLLYKLECTIAKAYGLAGREKEAKAMQSKADVRCELIQSRFFNTEAGLFVDLNVKDLSQTDVLSLAGAFPLFVNIATDQQAAQVNSTLRDKFLREGGWVTSLNYSDQQWDAPNGWAPLQWIVFQGLRNYGFEEAAAEGANKWIDNNKLVYKATGTLFEKYNVEELGSLAGGGEYTVQHGFGWTNGVLVKMLDVLGKELD